VPQPTAPQPVVTGPGGPTGGLIPHIDPGALVGGPPTFGPTRDAEPPAATTPAPFGSVVSGAPGRGRDDCTDRGRGRDRDRDRGPRGRHGGDCD
jgi:hypothetical protein